MEIFSLSGLFVLVVASLFQTNPVFGNPTKTTATTVKTRTGFRSSPKPPIKVSVWTCPQKSTILPCTCYFSLNYGGYVECSGSSVNESSIENTFREIRRVNKIPEDRGMVFSYFGVEHTQLIQLDLAPFYGSKIDWLQIRGNNNLRKLVTSGNPRHHRSIQVKLLEVDSSPLSRSGFGDTLKYFSNGMSSFTALYLNFKDYSKDEFLPGLSSLTNLIYLNFYKCNISGRLTSDNLIPKELQNLEGINLDSNKINEIGENVFDFEGREDKLYIVLSGNKLNETGFHPNSGITRVGRQTKLILHFNQITTLPAPIFESFLDAHPQNIIELYGNPLICDERLSWLKSRRVGFKSRVFNADCYNDEGHTAFDSDLIP